MDRPLNVAIAAGGTAGHINPALALAQELRDRGNNVVFVGQPTKLEGTLVPEAGFELLPIRVSGIDRSRPWTALTALVRLRKAKRALGAHFADTGAPDVAVGFGAYVELPLLDWCASHDVPVLIHEQNSVPGLANKVMASKAQVVAVALPQAVRALEPHAGAGTSIVVTGNPVRRSVIESDGARGRASLGVPEDATMLLVFGGSLGAQAINRTLAGLKDQLLSREGLHVVHATGKAAYDEVAEALDLTPQERERYHLLPYIDNMGDVLAGADLVVSRAGASSIAEIAALSVPAILVPYPHATADHQTVNAQFLVGAHAAVMVPDHELDAPAFTDALFGLLDDPEARAQMRANAKSLAQEQAAGHLADHTEKLGRRAG